MQQSMPSDSCTISVAQDGDVALFMTNPAFVLGRPCVVDVNDGTLVIGQKDVELVRIDGVSPEFERSILVASEVCIVNVLDAGRPKERMQITRVVRARRAA